MKKKVPAGYRNRTTFIVLALAAVLCIGFAGGVFATRLPHRIRTFTGYTDCTAHGGQLLSYDSAIQFSACRSNANLYLQYSAQDMPRLTAEKTQSTTNTVIADTDVSAGLVNFLKYDYTGCDGGKGYYKVLKEVPDRFAMMDYGCGTDGGQEIIAMNVGGKWTFISPTNNMQAATPSCLLVDMFKISKQLSSQCYQNTGYSDGSLRAVDYP